MEMHPRPTLWSVSFPRVLSLIATQIPTPLISSRTIPPLHTQSHHQPCSIHSSAICVPNPPAMRCGI
jgi:hypothetical protein